MAYLIEVLMKLILNIVNFMLQVAELAMKRGFLEGVILVRALLRILSTRVGTSLLCGALCFSKKWPYINKFSNISVEKREEVIQKWFKHRFLTPIRLPFVLLKFLCLYVFFTLVIMLLIGFFSIFYHALHNSTWTFIFHLIFKSLFTFTIFYFGVTRNLSVKMLQA